MEEQPSLEGAGDPTEACYSGKRRTQSQECHERRQLDVFRAQWAKEMANIT